MDHCRLIPSIFGILGTLAGCAFQPSDTIIARTGPPAVLTADATAVYAQRQQAVLANIRSAAGLTSDPTKPSEWRQFGIAAFNLADEQCEDYMAAIRRVNIARRQITQELNLLGTATVATMGITQVAREAVAITATAFGLAQATTDNIASGVLYDLPPDTVSDLVRRLRAHYDATISEHGDIAWADRPTAFRTIRGYIELCLPVVIESRIAASISGAVPEVKSPPPSPDGTGGPPLVSVQGPSAPSVPPPAPPPPVDMPKQFSKEQLAFRAAVDKLAHDPKNPKRLTPESSQKIQDCARPFPSVKGLSPAQIINKAGADLPTITSCISKK
jgi:hypothetical protein